MDERTLSKKINVVVGEKAPSRCNACGAKPAFWRARRPSPLWPNGFARSVGRPLTSRWNSGLPKLVVEAVS
jgi:hypothetical protein